MCRFLRLEGRGERAAFIAQRRRYNAQVRDAIRKVRRDYKHLKPSIVDAKFFGASNVAPEYLTICLFYRRDSGLAEAREKGYCDILQSALIAALSAECYTCAYVAGVRIAFLSRQTIKRTGGFWASWH